MRDTTKPLLLLYRNTLFFKTQLNFELNLYPTYVIQIKNEMILHFQ